MMLLALAALAQAPDLGADPRDAAMLCGAAVAELTPAITTRGAAHLEYFVWAAAGAGPQSGTAMERFRAAWARASEARARFAPGGALAGQARAVVAECDRRYPLARSAAPARLPAEPLQRDQMCFDMLATLSHVAGQAEAGGAPDFETLERAQLEYDARVRRGRMVAGLHDTIGEGEEEAVREEAFRDRLAALQYGNAEAISRACIAGLEAG